jgi:hypothetical protein
MKNKLDKTELGVSTLFAMRHQVKARKFPKPTLNSVNEAVVRRTANEFYITDPQRQLLKKPHTNLKQTINIQWSFFKACYVAMQSVLRS